MIIPDVLLTPFAASGDRATIPQEDSSGFINFTDGYTPFYEISLTANNPQAKAVERQGMNELFYQLSQNAMAWQQLSIAPWLAGTAGGYMINAQVARLGADSQARIYRSLIDNNTSDPLTNSSQWELQPRWSTMRANIPMPAGGAGLDASAELITATSGMNTNTLLNGTWEFATDAAAQACANMPTLFGSNVVRGMLESKSWTVGAQTIAVQRYTSVDGRQFVRGNNGSQWFAWSVVIIPSDIQSNRVTFTPITIGTGGIYSGTLTPAVSSFRDGQILWVYVSAKNPDGAVALTLNGGTAYPIVNETANNPLSGELYGGVCLMWEASNNRWRVITGMGIKSQSFVAVADYHLPTFKQVKDLIAAQGKPDWTDVQNKPLVVINGQSAQLLSIELIPNTAGAAFIDFHYGSDGADYNMRLVNDASNQLSVYSGAGNSPISISSTQIVERVPVVEKSHQYMNAGALYFSDSASAEMTAANQRGYIQAGSDGLYFYGMSGGTPTVRMVIYNQGSGAYFATRPNFAGATPWDSGNFTPANKLNAIPSVVNTTDLSVGCVLLQSGSWGSIAGLIGNTAVNNFEAPLAIGNSANTSASSTMVFYRGGQYAVHLGLDVDNVMKIGGWSMGAVAYPILHSGNLSSYVGAALAANAYDSVGQYGLFVASTGTGSGLSPIVPGALVAGSGLIYCATGYIASSSSYRVRPGGTWQCCSWLYNGDGASTDSIGIFRRVS